MARRRSSDDGLGCLVIIVLAVVLYIGNAIGWYAFGAIVVAVVAALVAFSVYRQKKAEETARAQQLEREEAERERRRHEEEALRQEREERERALRESLQRAETAARRERENRERAVREVMGRDATAEAVHYMSGMEFEGFMATFLQMQCYGVETTKASGDQGVDLLLTDPDGRRVAAQLKRYTRPVGNKAVQEVFAGRFHYKADEAWVIATTSFTRGAYEAARSTGVRLIDGDELAEWLRDVGEELRAPDTPETDPPTTPPGRGRRGTRYPHPDDLGSSGRS